MDTKTKCANRKCGWIGFQSEQRLVEIEPGVRESRCPRCDCNEFYCNLKSGEAEKPKTGAQLIDLERGRQIKIEGCTPQHDDAHQHGQMAAAALVYVETSLIHITYSDEAKREVLTTDVMAMRWPWDEEWFKPSPDPIRNLVKAGALIAAEIDRLQRLNSKP